MSILPVDEPIEVFADGTSGPSDPTLDLKPIEKSAKRTSAKPVAVAKPKSAAKTAKQPVKAATRKPAPKKPAPKKPAPKKPAPKKPAPKKPTVKKRR